MGKWKKDYNASRKYNQRWEEGREWLQSTPDEKCFCTVCKCTFKPKKSVVQQHEISVKHTSAIVGIEKPKRLYRKMKTEITDEKDGVENITFNVLNDEHFINSAFQNLRESGGKNMHSSIPGKSFPTKMEYADGVQVVYLKDVNESNMHESEDHLQTIIMNVTNTFKVDLERFLKKNTSITNLIENNEDFCSGVSGLSRLTRMLVGHMAQHYLLEYTVESLKNKTTPSCTNIFANKLNNIEKTIEQSVQEMKIIKEELALEAETQNLLLQPGIVLDSINVDL